MEFAPLKIIPCLALCATERSSVSGAARTWAGMPGSAILLRGAEPSLDSPGFGLQDNTGLCPCWQELGFLTTQETPGGKGEEKWGEASCVCVTDCWGRVVRLHATQEGLDVENCVFSQFCVQCNRHELCGVHFSQHCLLRGLSFPLVCPWPLCRKVTDPICVGLILDSVLFLWSLRLFFCQFHTLLATVASQYSVKSGSKMPAACSPFSGSLWLFGVLYGSTQMLGWFVLFLWKIPLEIL